MEVLHHRHMPTSLEDFRFMKHERRKNDVTLRQHDNCCFENNFLQTKYWPAVCCSHLVRQLPRICRASVIPIMGNCLKGSGQDDISLLHDEESTDSPRTGEPPPPYQVHSQTFIQIVSFDYFRDYFKSLIPFSYCRRKRQSLYKVNMLLISYQRNNRYV